MANAREELAKSLQISISYNNISTNIDNGKVTYSSFNETSTQKTNIELLGSFVIEEHNNIIGDFSNKVIIGMDSNISLPIYLEKLSDLKSQIEDDKYQKTEDLLKIQLLNYKIECYELFNSYKYIALELGANVNQIPLINITKLGLQIQLFELSTNMNVISDNSLNKSNIIKDTSNIKKNIDNTFSDIEKDKIKIIINNFRDTNLQDKSYINSIDIENDVNILLQIKTEWSLIWEPYNKIIEQEKALQDAIYLRKKEAIEKEPYRVAETVNGQILEIAKKARLDLIQDIDEKKNNNIDVFIAELISENFDSDFALFYEKTKKQLNYIDKRDYSLSLRNKNKLSLFIDDYDGIREALPCILLMKINNNELKYEFYLPYSKLAKIDAPNPKKCTDKEWYEYLDNVDIYDYLLNNYLEEFLDLQISFNVTAINSKINLNSLDIIRLDNNQIVYSRNIND